MDTRASAKIDGALDAAGLRLWKLEDGSLVLKYATARGEKRALVGPPRRALPLSEPERWIIFSDHDGVEVGVLASIDDLDSASQAVLREALRNEYSLRRIVSVLEVEREPLSGQTRWRVEIESPDEDAPVRASNSDGTGIASPEPEPEPQAEVEAEPEAEAAEGEERPGARARVASLLSLGRDRGAAEDAVSTVEREFTIAGQEDVQTARYPHIFIVDTDRQRYEITDCEALDADSRKAAERFF